MGDILQSAGGALASGRTRLRVRYCECDPMNVAHHASYAAWLEVARTELLRDAGVSYAQLEAGGVFLVVTRLDIRYRRPVRYDDVVEIHASVSGGGRVKIEHAYDLFIVERGGAAHDEGRPAAIGASTLACVNREGKVTPLPEWLVPKQGA